MENLDAITLEIQSLFYQGAYQACLESVRQNSSGPPSDPTFQQLELATSSSSLPDQSDVCHSIEAVIQVYRNQGASKYSVHRKLRSASSAVYTQSKNVHYIDERSWTKKTGCILMVGSSHVSRAENELKTDCVYNPLVLVHIWPLIFVGW